MVIAARGRLACTRHALLRGGRVVSTILMSCPLCGDSSKAAVEAMAGYSAIVQDACVCGRCAENIANAFSKKHSGRWLTWPEEQASPPKKNSKAIIKPALRTQVFERDKYRYLRCGTHLSLRADHIIPEISGGETTIDNLQTLCQPCTSWKGTKNIDFRRSM